MFPRYLAFKNFLINTFQVSKDSGWLEAILYSAVHWALIKHLRSELQEDVQKFSGKYPHQSLPKDNTLMPTSSGRPVPIKGCHEIFASDFFHKSSPPKPLKITLGSFWICSHSHHHRYQRHRWQILTPVPLVLLLPVANLLIEEFFTFAPGVRHRWCTLSCEYLREFSKKIETVLMV